MKTNIALLKIFCCSLFYFNGTHLLAAQKESSELDFEDSELAELQQETDAKYSESSKITQKRKLDLIDEEAPHKSTVGKKPNDDLMLSALKTADDHRNHRLHFTFEQSLNEAIRLYDLVVADHTVSPDLRARAKIDTAKIYVTLIKNNTNPEVIARSKNQVLTLVNEVLNDSAYSEDMKAWARRFQSKLYQKGFYDLPKEEALKKSKELLDLNLRTGKLSKETIGRTKMQLAMGYLKGFFEASDKLPIKMAYNIYSDIVKDKTMSSDLRAKAIMALFNYVQFYTLDNLTPEQIMQRRFQLINSALKFDNLSPLLTAHIKWLIGTNYLMNAFDFKPSEARRKAKNLFLDATNQARLTEKHRFAFKANLIKLYLQNSFENTPSQSRQEALKLVEELLQDLNVSKDQINDFKINVVEHFVQNDFKLSTEEAQRRGIGILESIIQDDKQNPSFIAQARWILGRYYIQGLLKPSHSPDGSLIAGVEIFKTVLQDNKISLEERNNYRLNLLNMLQNNIFGEEKTQTILNLMPEMKEQSS